MCIYILIYIYIFIYLFKYIYIYLIYIIYIKSNIDQSIRLMICLPALMEWTHGGGYNNYAPRGNVEILFHVFLLIYVCR